MEPRLPLLLVVLALLTGCPRIDETPVWMGGQTVSAAEIDADPVSLLPGGAIVTSRLDARALFASSLGPTTASLVGRLLPLGRESNFEASRDVRTVHGAFYAMQGADFCAVLQGTFDVASIARAAEARAATPSGTPLVRTPYAGYAIYTVANIGFAVLTPSTILSGDETGMRRALDRLRYGSRKRDLAPWMDGVLADSRAAFALVGDFERDGIAQAAAEAVPFVEGSTRLRALGNFQAPGINLVGTIGYRDADAATRGAANLAQVQQLTSFASMFTALAGAGAPRIDVRTHDKDVSFASSVDTAMMQILMNLAVGAIRPGASSWLGG